VTVSAVSSYLNCHRCLNVTAEIVETNRTTEIEAIQTAETVGTTYMTIETV